MDELTNEIIILIASYYPFPPDEIVQAYAMLGSIDATIAACNTAVSVGCGPVAALKMAEGRYTLKGAEEGER